MSFNLRALILETLANSSDSDPYINSKAVLGKINDSELREALEICLPFYVGILAKKQVPLPTQSTVQPVPVGVSLGSTSIVQATQGKTFSAKQIAGAKHLKFLRISVALDERASVHKFMADCTVDDIMKAVDIRRKKAKENESAADDFEAVAKKMIAKGAVVVGDLPDTDLDDIDWLL